MTTINRRPEEWMLVLSAHDVPPSRGESWTFWGNYPTQTLAEAEIAGMPETAQHWRVYHRRKIWNHGTLRKEVPGENTDSSSPSH